ncbi:hypothetical protein GYMLUDRAFT_196081 [Collybiopsis luxurians FD-317 M1]|uniref:Uncharacterized protein n=1 Tax=Collybiopsis luxurians FD-317 M1 TaxID=944289 RepID=A0A0D0D4C2_9AGAR|nr:hypothetical protein GYMLUDRAFT_196081 [Collybiopsis luxurians FD-317 M1]
MAHISNPIETFFSQYPEYDYDPTRETMTQFQQLCRFKGWNRDPEDPEKKEALEGVRGAIAQQFNAFYGSDENDLNAWHNLYRVLRAEDIPDSVEVCKKDIRGIHVNIWDLVDYSLHGSSLPPKLFPTPEALAAYTRKSRKIYPRGNAKAGGLLRFLLRVIYGTYHEGQRKGKGKGKGKSKATSGHSGRQG